MISTLPCRTKSWMHSRACQPKKQRNHEVSVGHRRTHSQSDGAVQIESPGARITRGRFVGTVHLSRELVGNCHKSRYRKADSARAALAICDPSDSVNVAAIARYHT